ncbi:hypothetical protein SAMN05421841_3482 [Chryseobacterium wanjuense]|jgi:hypothetical protein|uniref:Helix-turn-helix domain-containing protein n=1 Tax=Chryseobacterium wanjuense TaxID=356305 RepID=A0A1I0S003_9FLAO|nr:helix-turn-helix domain-containing protein [Chryseobacterium wanjuense]SEW47279.1 hypothetical protein SAMN05421841_3482 [Chryseobacterium wanjuense]
MKPIIKSKPNYKKIFCDIITLKHPDKLEYCREILAKDEILLFDVILLNKIIFGNGEKDTEFFNQQHKSYDEATINTILNYQKKHHLNNSEVSRHFKLSRNTIARWRKLFP